MRVELPEGYVPPEPTHPTYGYLTPEEQAEFEAAERARRGIVPGVVAGGPRVRGRRGQAISSWAPAAAPVTASVTAPVLTRRAGERGRGGDGRAYRLDPALRTTGAGRTGRAGGGRRVPLGRVRQEWVSTADSGSGGRRAARPGRRRRSRRARSVELVDDRGRTAAPLGRARAALGHRAARRARLAVWCRRPGHAAHWSPRASGGMADALASGASARKGVGVQVPPRAPTDLIGQRGGLHPL